MKRHHGIAAAMVGALTLAACGGGGEGGDADTEASGEITIWLSNNEQEVAWGEEIVEEWNADHPDQQVTAQEIPAGSSSEEVITAAITAGTAPCLVYNVSPAAAPQWQQQGGLVDLAHFEDGEAYLTERSGEQLDQYRSEEDGGIYQLPWKSNPVMVMYNRDMFADAGIDPDDPGMETFDGFVDGANALVDSGTVDTAIWPAPTSEFFQPWFDFYPLYLATTGGISLVEEGQATFDDENGRAVWEMWRQIYDDGLAPQESSNDDEMAQERTAMQLAGPWAVATYEDQINHDFMPVPTQDGAPAEETATFADAKNVSMFTSCQNQGTAWEFLQYSTSVEADGSLLEATGQMPLRTDLEQQYSDYFEENPEYADFAAAAAIAVDVPNVPNSVEAWQSFRDEYTRSVVHGETEVDQGLAAAADAVNGLVQE